MLLSDSASKNLQNTKFSAWCNSNCPLWRVYYTVAGNVEKSVGSFFKTPKSAGENFQTKIYYPIEMITYKGLNGILEFNPLYPSPPPPRELGRGRGQQILVIFQFGIFQKCEWQPCILL